MTSRENDNQPKCIECGRTLAQAGTFRRANAIGEVPATWRCDPECDNQDFEEVVDVFFGAYRAKS